MLTIKTRDDVELYCKVWGNGPPVVLIHGWPLSSDSWDTVALALAENGFRAIAYDRRGFGRSAQPWSGYDYDTLSDDLADVMAATGADSGVTLVGFSMGGGEVARYMSRHAGKGVTATALIASIVPFMALTDDNPDGVPQATFDEMERSIHADRPQFMRGFLDDFFGVGLVTSPVSAEMLNWAWHMCMQAGLKPTLACAHAFATTDFRNELAHFRVPTLIVHGTDDKTVPIATSARHAAEVIPHSVLKEYVGAPHGLFATHGGRLVRDLLQFLRDEKAMSSDAI